MAKKNYQITVHNMAGRTFGEVVELDEAEAASDFWASRCMPVSAARSTDAVEGAAQQAGQIIEEATAHAYEIVESAKVEAASRVEDAKTEALQILEAAKVEAAAIVDAAKGGKK